LLILDKALRIRSANASFFRKFKVTEQETEGKLFYDVGNGQWDIQPLRTVLQNILPGKTVMEDFEMTHNFPSIGERTMLLNARRIIIEKSNEQLILLAIEDVTEIKKAEQKQKDFAQHLETRVKERTTDLQKVNSELEQFAHVASHDLQEPVRKILTFINRVLGSKEEFSSATKNYLNKIENASERMTAIIQDLLSYAHLLNSETLLEETDLNKTFKNILDDFELQIEEKKAQIKSEKLPIIEALPLQMNQLFYNLLSNSLKFSKNETPPVIKITSRKLSAKEIKEYPALNAELFYCEIVFQDNGIGFDQKYAHQIFTIFQQLNDRKEYTGTGIGLSIVKKIVENHHGEIYVEAKENEGAAFHVILPVKQTGN
jgi:two-component system CheB/CheR fusion protein